MKHFVLCAAAAALALSACNKATAPAPGFVSSSSIPGENILALALLIMNTD
jgi:hypothetical protein